MTTATQDEVRLYSLGQESKRTGLFGLPMRATVIAGGALALAMMVAMTGRLLTAGLLALAATLYLIPAIARDGNRTWYEVWQMWFQFKLAKAQGRTTYRSGPNSNIPGGRYRLPGFLARSELHVGTDMYNNEFGMIRDPALNQFTVLISASPRGGEPWTITDRNLMTREWGAWLADLSLTGDVVGASMTIETVPASGQDLVESVLGAVDESSPELARRIQAESAVQFTRNQLSLRGWAAVTVRAANAMQRKDPAAMATELGQRLPNLYRQLQYAGVSARPMTPTEIVGLTMSAYRPETGDAVVSERLSGNDLGIDWEDAGPATAVTEWDHYRHSEFVSKSFEMALPPQSTFPDTVLRPLLEPHIDLPRKRVTLVYRPFAAGESVKLVENEHNDAVNAVNAGRNGRKLNGAKVHVRLEQTDSARQSLARGAQLGQWSLLSTVSLESGDKIAPATAIMTQLGNRAQIGLRPMNGQQDAAFAAALGVGVYLHQKSTISAFAKAG
ncbi:SCO6880 family protein [Rhodococcus sp. IEGM 1408]|uniref:SCO6880 family protein n=1 Tax=Rhodococcus sp. IEGM 1408 TaxID=3082220 RepID=UPI002955CD7D|nr:SCO6880 family protein [Rhodococcus sp. IEGM 1408]MDV8002844.1 SCO6880 family protein [Rhodococcus sp. IEGM 1408]